MHFSIAPVELVTRMTDQFGPTSEQALTGTDPVRTVRVVTRTRPLVTVGPAAHATNDAATLGAANLAEDSLDAATWEDAEWR